MNERSNVWWSACRGTGKREKENIERHAALHWLTFTISEWLVNGKFNRSVVVTIRALLRGARLVLLRVTSEVKFKRSLLSFYRQPTRCWVLLRSAVLHVSGAAQIRSEWSVRMGASECVWAVVWATACLCTNECASGWASVVCVQCAWLCVTIWMLAVCMRDVRNEWVNDCDLSEWILWVQFVREWLVRLIEINWVNVCMCGWVSEEMLYMYVFCIYALIWMYIYSIVYMNCVFFSSIFLLFFT